MRALCGLFLLVLASAAPAQETAWRMEHGSALAAPLESNSNILHLEVTCGDPFHLAVYTLLGPVLPAGGQGEADYFYQPGRVEAEVDGHYFPLAAAGSEDAVVLFGQGTAEENFLADLDPALISLLKEGRTLTLSFDITPEPNAETDSPFETFARFPLDGAAAAIESALSGCS